MKTGVYLTQDPHRIHVTLNMIHWFRGFIRSEATHARNPLDPFRHEMTKEEAQIILSDMVNEAINKKAQIPSRGRKDCTFYQTKFLRDKWAIRAKLDYRVRIYQFETPEVRARFSHLLSDRNED